VDETPYDALDIRVGKITKVTSVSSCWSVAHLKDITAGDWGPMNRAGRGGGLPSVHPPRHDFLNKMLIMQCSCVRRVAFRAA
jgi:hypothetical protein